MKLKVETEICAIMGCVFPFFLIASEASIYVVDLTTAIELSSIHRPDRLNILLLIYFPLKRKEHFSWHVSPGLM